MDKFQKRVRPTLKWLRELEWLVSLGDYVIKLGFVVSAVVGVGLAALRFLEAAPLSSIIFFGLGAFTFVFVVINVVAIRRDLRREPSTGAEPESIEANGPIRISIPTAFPAKTQDGVDTPIILAIVSVSNLGEPTVVDDWRISVVLPGGEKRDLTIMDLMTTHDTLGNWYRLDGGHMIHTRTADPVTTGQRIYGILAGAGTGLRYDAVTGADVTVVIKCRDIQGRQYVCESGLSPNVALESYPGLEWTPLPGPPDEPSITP